MDTDTQRELKELLATRDTDSLNEMIPEILEGIFPVARYPTIGRQLVIVDNKAGTPGRSAVYVKEKMSTDTPRALINIYDPVEVPEGGGIPETAANVDYITVTPIKYGKRPYVTRELIEDAQWDVIAMNTQMVMAAAREWEDKFILDGLFVGAATGNAITTATANTIASSEIRTAIRYLTRYGWQPSALVCNPTHYMSLLAYADAASTSGIIAEQWKASAISTGNVPPLYGIPTYMTPLMTDNSSGVERSLLLGSKPGVLTVKRDWTLEAVADPVAQTQGLTISARLGLGVLHPTAIVPITDLS
jgi:HK97 family phage major capsid protein